VMAGYFFPHRPVSKLLSASSAASAIGLCYARDLTAILPGPRPGNCAPGDDAGLHLNLWNGGAPGLPEGRGHAAMAPSLA
jgi:hypothetical protein